MEIKAQDTSYKDEAAGESDSSSNKQTIGEDDKFEFITEEKEIPIIDGVEVDKALAANISENNLQSYQHSSSLNNDEVVEDEVVVVPSNDTLALFENDHTNNLENDTVEKNEVSDLRKRPFDDTKPTNGNNALNQVEVLQLSDSEKINKILLNQVAEQKVLAELTKRMDGVEKHIKKYGGGPWSKVLENLTLQVASKDMFSKLEMDLLESATKNAVASHFNKTIFEKNVKQFVKILLLKFFDEKFYAHGVTGKSGGTVVLIRSETLSCIYDCIQKKFGKKQRDVEDTVFKAIDQLKDCLRKKFPKSPGDRKRKPDRPKKEDAESFEERKKNREAAKKRKRDRIRERLEREEMEGLAESDN